MADTTTFEEFDPHKYWLVLKRRWPVLLITLGSCIALAAALAYGRKPTYEAQGQLLVQANRTQSLTGVGEKIGSLESLKREGNPMDTQAVVLQSSPLVQRVIDNLQLKDPKGKPLQPRDLKLKVEPIVSTDVMKVSYSGDNPQMVADVINQLMQAYIDSNVQTNRTEAVAAGSFIEQQLPRAKAELEESAQALRQFREQNSIVELDKESIATIDSLKNLSDQSSQAQAQLAELSAQQAALASQGDIDALSAIDSASLSQLPGVQSALSELQKVESQLAIERTRYRDDHPNVAVLLRQVAALQGVLADRIGSVAVSNSNDLQMSPLRQTLVSNYVQLQAQRQGLASKIAALQDLQTNFKQRAEAIPSLNKTQEDLVRQFAMAKKTYETLKTKLEDVRIAESQTVGNARIIQPALVPTSASTKTKQLLLLGGTGLGLMLGLALAFWVDLIDRSLKSVKEAQNLFGYSLLGVIPRFRVAAGWESANPGNPISARVTVANGPRSIVHEAYRMLQANLKFTNLDRKGIDRKGIDRKGIDRKGIDRKVKTIVITSSLPEEGKSEVTANLAATLAQSGKRVLLIDADMRSPSQHHLFGIVNSVGLSDLIVEPELMNNVFQSVIPNLTLITAGAMPPDPVSLLESESMVQLLAQFKQDYEYILFDSPPLAGMADAAMLGNLACGVVLVVRPKFVTYSSAISAKDLLVRSGVNVLGLVANGVNMRQEPENFHYYKGAKGQKQQAVSLG